VEDGLIRFTGVSEQYFADHLHETVIQGITDHAFDVVMVGYNMLSPSARSTVFPLAVAHEVGVVIMCAIRGVIANPAQLEAVIRNWARNGWIDRAGTGRVRTSRLAARGGRLDRGGRLQVRG
jgi:aryl-alcohol dehydrogenase-like predicted oxidoreductase